MCYSILVETDLKRLGIDFQAKVDVEAFVRIYEARAQGEKNLHIPRGIDAHFASPESPAEKKARELIDQFTSGKIQELQETLSKKEAQVLDLKARLEARWFKTHQKSLDTAQRVIEKTRTRISRLEAPYEHGSHEDSRAVQYSYVPLILLERGKRVIRPFRYQIRSRFAAKEPNRNINMFNVRLETVEERTSWKPLFMAQHAVLRFKGFYEWVPHPESGKTSEIYFFPRTQSPMWAPALYERFEGEEDGAQKLIDSFAILTTDPPTEVERMGHDRCPLYPPWDFVGDWLNPDSCNREYIKKRLLEKEPVEYAYLWAER